MSEAVVDDIVAVLPPLLQSLEALGFVARHLNPPDFDSVMEAARRIRSCGRSVRGWPIGRSHSQAYGTRSKRPAMPRWRLLPGCGRYSTATVT